MQTDFLKKILAEPFINMGEVIDSRFNGIYAPERHLDSHIKEGQVYDFDKSRNYHQQHYYPDGIKRLLRKALQHITPVKNPLILDIGSGSGNSITAVLQTIEACNVVGTDLSPNLLYIMKDELARAGLPAECISLICMDAHEPYFKPNSFDLVCGSAILHHLVDPRKAIMNAMSALKPNGAAIFFEPFEYGCTILKLIHDRVLRESEIRDQSRIVDHKQSPLKPDVAAFLRDISHDYFLRSNVSGGVKPFTAELDDKWLFNRKYFEGIKEEIGASKLITYSNHEGHLTTLFEDYVGQNFHLGRDWKREVMPEWAWEVVRGFDRTISDEMKLSFMIEGTVIFIK